MGGIYQLTFFLAVTLLAIVITIFVFAVSLLGRAVEAAAISESDKVAETKAKNVEEMAAIKKEIEKAEASGQIPKGLTQKLKKLEKRDKNFEKELGKIRRAPELLTVRGGVVHPGISLGIALILSGVAWYLSNTIQVFTIPIPLIMWILGLTAIGYSISRIYKSLRIVESVAITSEEAAEGRLAQAVKAALVEVEEGKKPKLALVFQDKKPPFHVEAGQEMPIKLDLRLIQGDLARKPIVYFLAPPGFGFPRRKTWLQPEDRAKVGGHITTQFEFDECRRGTTSVREIAVKAPPDKGSFSLSYRLTCEGFDSGCKEFEVIVG